MSRGSMRICISKSVLATFVFTFSCTTGQDATPRSDGNVDASDSGASGTGGAGAGSGGGVDASTGGGGGTSGASGTSGSGGSGAAGDAGRAGAGGDVGGSSGGGQAGASGGAGSGGQDASCEGGLSNVETCNGVDDNCNGQIDESDPLTGTSCTVSGAKGECANGTWHCDHNVAHLVCKSNNQPTIEICNGLDDNCDGQVDENNPGGGVPCDNGMTGVCAGRTDCQGGPTCVQPAQPSAEVCDGKDNNCNGSTDEDNPTTMCIRACGGGVVSFPHVTSTACTAGACIISCATGYYDKNGNYCDGCESTTP